MNMQRYFWPHLFLNITIYPQRAKQVRKIPFSFAPSLILRFKSVCRLFTLGRTSYCETVLRMVALMVYCMPQTAGGCIKFSLGQALYGDVLEQTVVGN